ncbi:hypothetical protein RQP46_002551 [Phenoliferia psychrophenolica]
MARATFSTLPPELKARIVEMTRDQEDAYKIRERAQPEARVGHINSLSSLALVNREFRELAAKHQFVHLSSGKASRPVFRFAILPRYGHHITNLYFFGNDEILLDNAIAALPQLPSLRTLSFTHEAAVVLFGPGVALRLAPEGETDAGPFRVTMLDNITSRITELSLHGFPPSASVALVQRFSNLRSLFLADAADSADNVEGFRSLASALSTRRHLTHLAIDWNAGSMAGWPMEAFGPLDRAPPPLKTLELLWLPLDHHTINLIDLFSATLETLSLELWVPLPEPDLSSREPLQLPHLTHFNLIAEPLHMDDTLRLITTSSTLTHFSLFHNGTGVDPSDPALLSLLATQSKLSHVSLGKFTAPYPFVLAANNPSFPPSSIAAYADLVRTRGFHPGVLLHSHLDPFHPKAQLDYTEDQTGHLVEALGRTLDFGRIELERMVAEGRAASAAEWVAMLKPLEDKRRAWED